MSKTYFLIVNQKITVQSTLHETIAYTWGIHVFFHTVSACASKLHERIEIMVYVPVSFFGGEFLGVKRFLAIR